MWTVEPRSAPPVIAGSRHVLHSALPGSPRDFFETVLADNAPFFEDFLDSQVSDGLRNAGIFDSAYGLYGCHMKRTGQSWTARWVVVGGGIMSKPIVGWGTSMRHHKGGAVLDRVGGAWVWYLSQAQWGGRRWNGSSHSKWKAEAALLSCWCAVE